MTVKCTDYNQNLPATETKSTRKQAQQQNANNDSYNSLFWKFWKKN
jgi:hypothetical protein